jgi:hypothetical protein
VLGLSLIAAGLGWNALRLPDSLDPTHDDGELTPAGHVQLGADTLTKWVIESTPEDAVLLCNDAPILSLSTGRRAYTWRYARSPQIVDRYRPDYVLLENIVPPSFTAYVRTKGDLVQRFPGPGRGVLFDIYRMRYESEPPR